MTNFTKNNKTKRNQKTYISELRHIICRSKSKANFLVIILSQVMIG